MGMLVVLIMNMRVVVLERFVIVHMLMAFVEMQIESDSHEQTGANQLQGYGLAEQNDSEDGPDKRRQ